MIRRRLAIALPMLTSPWVFAQADWPNRPVRIIVPLPPGGVPDYLARILGERLSEQFGQPFIVENKVGAGGVIAADYVARQAPDGYTLGMVIDLILVHKLLYRNVRYDVMRDFAPVATVAKSPFVLVVRADSSIRSARDFVAQARSKPLNYGSSGVGSVYHLLAELYRSALGLDLRHIPYRGTSMILTALLAGEIDCAFAPIGPFVSMFKSGQLRPVAVCGAATPALAGVPSMPAELGEPSLMLDPWLGMLAPKGTPVTIVQKVNAAVNKILADPVLAKERLQAQGFEPFASSPEEMAKVMLRDQAFYAKAVQSAKIVPE